jgi:hypothetical protein
MTLERLSDSSVRIKVSSVLQRSPEFAGKNVLEGIVYFECIL